MGHIPHLITDLALILGVAGVTTLICKKIHQPVVLGYILAGLLVGPHVSLFPSIVDAEGILVWSEIGVIFLLFSLGLEFSFRKLASVGGSATISAMTGVILMIVLGFMTGRLLGWSLMDSIFLGAILSMSSTTIIIRAIDEVGVRTKKFVTLVMGILIIQDLAAVLLLVFLSTLAVSQQFAGGDLMRQIFKLGFFLILWFLAGIFFVPTFLKRTRKLMNDETMLIVSLALCLGMVILAVQVGFSAALGAFIMGSILAETTQAERIEHLVKSVRDLFAAIFFVSVGMMIDPSVVQNFAIPIVVITIVTIAGKLLTTLIGALVSGQSLKHSIQSGMSLAQIGEFSFIIASLGVSLKVTGGFLYPIAVAVSAITTFATPFMITRSSQVYTWIEARLPQNWVNNLNRYSTGSQQLSAYGEWRELLRSYLVNFVIHSVLIAAIVLLCDEFVYPLLTGLIGNIAIGKIVTLVFTLLLMVPFIWALAMRRINKSAYANLWLNRKLNRGPLIAIEITRIVIAAIHIGIAINLYFPLSVAFLIAVVAMALAIAVFSQKLQTFYDRVEKTFLSNLNDRELQKVVRHDATPWDAHLADFEILPEFRHAGKQLQQLALREKYGVNIAFIDRGKLSILVPDRYERLYPGDKISIIGTDDQLSRIRELFEYTSDVNNDNTIHPDEITLQNLTVTKDSRMCRMSIRHSGLRQEGKAMVVGLERNGTRLLNPDSKMVLQEGDVIWIVGVKQRIEDFLGQRPRPLP